jgi:hypothetical protein
LVQRSRFRPRVRFRESTPGSGVGPSRATEERGSPGQELGSDPRRAVAPAPAARKGQRVGRSRPPQLQREEPGSRGRIEHGRIGGRFSSRGGCSRWRRVGRRGALSKGAASAGPL